MKTNSQRHCACGYRLKARPDPRSFIRTSVIFICLASSLATGSVVAEDYTSAPALEEITVTAQKRGAESLQDVALSAAVISSDMIDLKQMVGMDDYLRTLPSVNFQEYGAGRSTIIIRGTTADPMLGTQTTGVYIDEVPLSGMGDFETSSPELKLVDVNRVEILRGPQGTLYGSGSVGGTVRIITEQPRLDEFSGSIAGSWSNTAGQGSENYDAQGVINIPLKEGVFAIRAVAYYFDNSGYFQSVAASDPVKSASAAATGGLVVNRDDVGSSTYKGGRISALWTPTDKLSFNLMFLDQKIGQEGQALGDLPLGKFQQSRYSRLSTGRGEYTQDELSVLNLTIEYDFDQGSLVSSTSWNDYKDIEDWDIGQFLAPFYGEDSPLYLYNTTSTESFVQELRFSSQWDHPFNFLAGMYYENRKPTITQFVNWEGDPSLDPFEGELMGDDLNSIKVEQLAFFGELYWDINEKLTATAGMRHFKYKKSADATGDGVLVGGPYRELSSAEEADNTYKLNLSYRPNESALYYAQFSQGFRLGEPLIPFEDRCDEDFPGLKPPTQLDSDTLDAYELGSKLSFADNRVEVRGAVFYNDWKNIPIAVQGDCGEVYQFNAGRAMTRGVELEGSARLSEHWRFATGPLGLTGIHPEPDQLQRRHLSHPGCSIPFGLAVASTHRGGKPALCVRRGQLKACQARLQLKLNCLCIGL